MLTASAAIGSIEATGMAATVLAQLGGGKLRSVFNRFSGVDTTVQAKQGKSLVHCLLASLADTAQSKL